MGRAYKEIQTDLFLELESGRELNLPFAEKGAISTGNLSVRRVVIQCTRRSAAVVLRGVGCKDMSLIHHVESFCQKLKSHCLVEFESF